MTAYHNIVATVFALSPVGYGEPKAALMISDSQMPMRIIEEELISTRELDQAIFTYNLLKKSFAISTKEMSNWLGVKRRSLYNWLGKPSSSKKCGKIIEKRLSNLLILKDEMEPEHLPFIYKIAFSPIYGNPDFGEDIYSGVSSSDLIKWYDTLYGKIESYRRIYNKNIG